MGSPTMSHTPPHPQLILPANVSIESVKHRGRSNTGDITIRNFSPHRKRSASENAGDGDSDEDDLISKELGVPTSPKRSSLRFQSSPREGDEKKEKSIRFAEKEPSKDGLIRVSRKPLLRKTNSEKFSQNIDNKAKEVNKKPITQPVWSDKNYAETPEPVILRNDSKKSTDYQKRLSVGRKVNYQLNLKSRGTWDPKKQNLADGQSKMSSSVFSITKQMLAKRAAEKVDLNEPRVLKTPFSVTCSKDPKDILKYIETYFKIAGIPFEAVGSFALKGLIVESNIRFEIEICQVPNLQNLYSIRMQRIDGDWEKYKEFCETLFADIKL